MLPLASSLGFGSQRALRLPRPGESSQHLSAVCQNMCLVGHCARASLLVIQPGAAMLAAVAANTRASAANKLAAISSITPLEAASERACSSACSQIPYTCQVSPPH